MDKVRKFCETRGFKVTNYKGSGSYGKVFYVESQVTHLRYVAKVCQISKAFTQKNFWREAGLQKAMSSKYIVKLHEASIVTFITYAYFSQSLCIFFLYIERS